MKKLIIVLISVILLTSLLSCDLISCDLGSVFDQIIADHPSSNELFIHGDRGESEYVGVYLTLEGAEYIDGAWRIEVRWHNETDYEVTYGASYTIEYYDGEEWKNITIADVEFIEIAYLLRPHSESGETYTTKYFDVSREGKYRLRTEFNISDESYTGSRVITLEFRLSEQPNVTEAPIVNMIETDKLPPIDNETESDKYSSESGQEVDASKSVEEILMNAWKQDPRLPQVKVQYYYGEYGDNCLVAIMGSGLMKKYYGRDRVESVGGIEFQYYDYNSIVVFKNGVFYTLNDALNEALLDTEDLKDIASQHKKFLRTVYY